MSKLSKIKQTGLKNLLLSSGAAKVGFADLKILNNTKFEYSSGVSILANLNPVVIASIKNGPTLAYSEEYSRVNNLLNKLSEIACNFLQDLGYKAKTPKATVKSSELENFKVDIPHKTVALLSGLGWIGKNALLITEEFGSAIRLTSVFTNAIFDYDLPANFVKCGKCLKCKTVCPGNAIKGNNWYKGINSENFYKPELCREAMEKFTDTKMTKAICGICISNCPFTVKYIKQSTCK